MPASSVVEPSARSALTRFAVPLAGLVTSLLCVALLWRAQGLVDSRPDPYQFSAMAESLLRGEGFSKFGNLLMRRTPGYPFFLAGLYTVFGVRLLPVQLVQCLLFAGTCWFAQDLGRRIFNPRAGLLAGLLCAVHPSLLRYVPDLHLETLLTFLFTLSIWLSARFFDKPSWQRGIPLGIVWGMASLTKAVVLLYPAVFAVLWWLNTRRRAARAGQPAPPLTEALRVGVALAAMALTIAPWTIRNFVVTNHFVPITSGASDAVLRSYVFSRTEFITLRKPPYTDAENEVNADFQRICEAQGTTWQKDDYETDKILNKVAKERVLSDPAAYIKKSLTGVFTFWYQMTSLPNSLFAGAMALIGWSFAAVGLSRAFRERRPAWLVLAPIVYLNLFLAALLSLGRYSVPVWPCLVVLAAFGLDTLIARFRSEPAAAPAS